jgi:N-acetyl-anhydromuramyl-L-alanine amidase AmpD
MAIIDEWHRDKGWDGVGYDFVIGNGTDSRDGQVEVTFRWRQQLVGAHTKTPNNWGNEDTIGICLVGDFTQDRPSWKQLDSLKKLIRFLQQRYRIPTSRVYGHGSTPGARVTDCPGKNFPMWSFKSQL